MKKRGISLLCIFCLIVGMTAALMPAVSAAESGTQISVL